MDPQVGLSKGVGHGIAKLAVKAKRKMLEAMRSSGLKLADCSVSVIVTFRPDRAAVQPVPWLRGEPWPAKTELHQQAYLLSAGGLQADYRKALLFTMDLPEPQILVEDLTPQPMEP